MSLKLNMQLCTAMVTPFDPALRLDTERLCQLADYLIAQGSDALVAVGTTGESPTLSHAEKLKVFETLSQHLKGRVPLIAGTGSYSTAEAVQLSQEAEAAGANALLVVNPYYNKPSQEGLYRHFSAVAQAVSIPLILYNHPGRTGVSLSVETVCRLAEHENIVAIKDSSGDLVFITELLRRLPEFSVFSGDDPLTLPILALGGQGVISVVSHLAGREVKALIEAFAEGDMATAQRLNFQLLPLTRALFSAPSPAPVKAALAWCEQPVGGVRLPLIDLNDSEKQVLEGIWKSFCQEGRISA
ncbi:4-hydroxy-tetrahydrodipicolinate synthase [bacterium (Candidatus Blackallbacteria) CG17_big_fil_post_rev_8_21_14_2_50_48_46]|uniref:4-hydroxy-tetrahydrodipicolinate synthase n=1 Tax=bacterium (Candidatus Blackallbacteria) CG17_big_fil_post_rev_8_21_14_2_50_48_46 TaxID=2014261 RepID=A0A2M7FZG0_9BACT|nr:MAG: 4-hydroxy-tetrahydrodipicolinate synthase [bacterium (Candidatus Blackallbacteria) CG18_big_fil_WC_8_21_14_2_50_49_26]PIW14783.1 MAG: 4-hydroxy-tetrahydrodipicolinate synthase [bacterium (Candidatus Blackallbacteria) CG17_big_fil_post_rev_8_21_14_2_50_48_46]PIW50885.1 MAG: 4-hydroxy-tetrahydrodipicolinate synthase [bacterium (Candidatus Blackallbacteria) CG13_big_fil_rev_8_21_14_2_50_49_14]